MMKRYLLALVAILLFTTSAFASGIYQPIARGTVTQANMRISAVDGTAFIDFSAADILTTKLGTLLKIRDSAGRLIQGFPQAVGTGETYLDVLSGWNLTNWTLGTGGTIIDADSYSTSEAGGIRKNSQLITNALYKRTLAKTTTAASSGLTTCADVGSRDMADPILLTGSDYRVGVAAYPAIYLRNSTSGTTDITSLKYERVLTTSITGVTISSTKGGSTMNWATKDAAFNYNDPSGYTYEIYRVLQAPIVLSQAIAAGNALIDATDANAFAAPVGVDLSPYQDGRHILAMYDANGYAALAWISATAPSGEALEADALNGWNLTSGWTSNGTITDANTITATATTATAVRNGNTFGVVGSLNKVSSSITVAAGTIKLTNGAGSTNYNLNAANVVNAYYTAVADRTWRLQNTGTSAGQTFDINSMSLQVVTMPAATGALLLSTKGGSRGWIYKHANFNPNAAITAKVLFAGD